MTIRIGFKDGRHLILKNVVQYTLKNDKRLVIEFDNSYESIFVNFDEVLHMGEITLYNLITKEENTNE